MIFTSDITVKLIQSVGDDSTVVAAAKVSTSGDECLKFLDKEANFGLINYLLKHRHGTPTESNSMTFYVSAPIFCWREHHRHRIGFSYSEVSGRYKQLEPKFWIPKEDRKIIPVEGYKAARPEFQAGNTQQYNDICSQIKDVCQHAYTSYEKMVNNGYAKEVARAVLPVNTYSECWVTCNARSLMHFLSLRTHEKDAKFISYPQAEIEEIARQYESIFAEKFPLVYKAFCENGRVAP